MSRLANIIDVEVWMDIPAVDTPETTEFFRSGVAVRNELLDTIANAPGKTAELIFWKDINPSDEENYSNDSPADTATPKLIEQGDMIARKAFLNQAWSESDLAAELAVGGNAMRRIRARVDTYWQHRWQARVVSTAIGVFLANVAQDSGDMVHDVSIADGDAATDDNKFSRSGVIEAAFTMGDRFEGLRTFVVHSVIAQRMIENDDIVYIADSKGELTIPTYLGRRVVVTDSAPVIAGGTSGFRYVSMLFGAAAFAYGEGSPEVPVEVERQALQGNGGGVENLVSRKTWMIHPLGHKFTSNTVTGPTGKTVNNISPTNANLRLAANWDRVFDRKLIPLAYYVTNG